MHESIFIYILHTPTEKGCLPKDSHPTVASKYYCMKTTMCSTQ